MGCFRAVNATIFCEHRCIWCRREEVPNARSARKRWYMHKLFRSWGSDIPDWSYLKNAIFWFVHWLAGNWSYRQNNALKGSIWCHEKVGPGPCAYLTSNISSGRTILFAYLFRKNCNFAWPKMPSNGVEWRAKSSHMPIERSASYRLRKVVWYQSSVAEWCTTLEPWRRPSLGRFLVHAGTGTS